MSRYELPMDGWMDCKSSWYESIFNGGQKSLARKMMKTKTQYTTSDPNHWLVR